MINALKESFRHFSLLKQFIMDNGAYYKVIPKAKGGNDALLANFILKNNHVIKTNRELSDKLDLLLEHSKEILKRIRKN